MCSAFDVPGDLEALQKRGHGVPAINLPPYPATQGLARVAEILVLQQGHVSARSNHFKKFSKVSALVSFQC